MHLITSNKTFGYFFSGIFFILSTIFFFFKSDIFLIFFILFVLFIFTSYFFPDVLTPLNKLWELFGLLLHKIISTFIIVIIYYLVFLIMGIFLRIFGFDPLNKKAFQKNKTYWKLREIKPNTFRDLF